MEGFYSEVLQNAVRFATIHLSAHYLLLRIECMLSGIDVDSARVLPWRWCIKFVFADGYDSLSPTGLLECDELIGLMACAALRF
jgi:hypothetical protein